MFLLFRFIYSYIRTRQKVFNFMNSSLMWVCIILIGVPIYLNFFSEILFFFLVTNTNLLIIFFRFVVFFRFFYAVIVIFQTFNTYIKAWQKSCFYVGFWFFTFFIIL